RGLNCQPVVEFVAVFGHGQPGEQPCSGEQGTEKPKIEAMAQLPSANEWDEKKHTQQNRRDHDCTPHFSAAREVFEELKEEQEIPFGSSRGVGLRSVGWGAQLRARLVAEESRPQDQEQNRGQYC